MSDYYKILGVTPNVTPEDLETAYLKAISTYKEGSIATYWIIPENERTNMLNMIETAFKTLKDKQTREEYDQSMIQTKDETVELNKDNFKSDKPTKTNKEKIGQLVLDLVNKYGKKETSSGLNQIKEASFTPSPLSISGLTQLKSIRELKGISLRDIANETKISTTYLKAIEEGDYSEMPEDIYARGFIRAYASYLGLNSEQFIEGYTRDKIK